VRCGSERPMNTRFATTTAPKSTTATGFAIARSERDGRQLLFGARRRPCDSGPYGSGCAAPGCATPGYPAPGSQLRRIVASLGLAFRHGTKP